MLRLCIALIFLLFIACKKDNNTFSLVGKWQLTDYFDGNTAWGGCGCWKVATAAMQHTVVFRSDGTYQYTAPLVASSLGCSGIYERKNDSTLRWNKCGPDQYDALISQQVNILTIKENQFGGFFISKYKRIR